MATFRCFRNFKDYLKRSRDREESAFSLEYSEKSSPILPNNCAVNEDAIPIVEQSVTNLPRKDGFDLFSSNIYLQNSCISEVDLYTETVTENFLIEESATDLLGKKTFNFSSSFPKLRQCQVHVATFRCFRNFRDYLKRNRDCDESALCLHCQKSPSFTPTYRKFTECVIPNLQRKIVTDLPSNPFMLPIFTLLPEVYEIRRERCLPYSPVSEVDLPTETEKENLSVQENVTDFTRNETFDTSSFNVNLSKEAFSSTNSLRKRKFLHISSASQVDSPTETENPNLPARVNVADLPSKSVVDLPSAIRNLPPFTFSYSNSAKRRKICQNPLSPDVDLGTETIKQNFSVEKNVTDVGENVNTNLMAINKFVGTSISPCETGSKSSWESFRNQRLIIDSEKEESRRFKINFVKEKERQLRMAVAIGSRTTDPETRKLYMQKADICQKYIDMSNAAIDELGKIPECDEQRYPKTKKRLRAPKVRAYHFAGHIDFKVDINPRIFMDTMSNFHDKREKMVNKAVSLRKTAEDDLENFNSFIESNRSKMFSIDSFPSINTMKTAEDIFKFCDALKTAVKCNLEILKSLVSLGSKLLPSIEKYRQAEKVAQAETYSFVCGNRELQKMLGYISYSK